MRQQKGLQPFRFKPSKLSCVDMIMNLGGEIWIRTLDTLLTYTHFPGVLLQPLGHFTMAEDNIEKHSHRQGETIEFEQKF